MNDKEQVASEIVLFINSSSNIVASEICPDFSLPS